MKASFQPLELAKTSARKAAILAACMIEFGTPGLMAQALGQLDATFGTGGKVITSINTGTDLTTGSEGGNSVVIQADGKIIVAGTTHNGSNSDFAVLRYNVDGTLDTTLNGTGKVTTAVGLGDDIARAAALQADGKIVVAGWASNGSNNDIALARYKTDGTLDTTFNGSGKVTTSIGSNNETADSVVIQPDGKIITAGQINNSSAGSGLDFALVRYNTDGSLDTTFAGTGKVVTTVSAANDDINDVKLQEDGKIVVAGWARIGTRDAHVLARYHPNGSLDTTFGVDGISFHHDISGFSIRANAVVIQSDGKIVTAGTDPTGVNLSVFAIRRYHSNGSLDTTFDGDGKAATQILSGGKPES
jgi:uncharacterized delta-60 repeat protein